MSTPKISFKVPKEGTEGSADPETQGDVTAHDLSSAPGKEREREPVFGGDIANISNEGQQAMDVDDHNGGTSCAAAWMQRWRCVCMHRTQRNARKHTGD